MTFRFALLTLVTACSLLLVETHAYADQLAITVEEERVPVACGQMQNHKKGSICALPKPLAQSLPATVKTAQEYGHLLWRQAQQPYRPGLIDDRPLYWQRLSVKRRLKTEGEVDASLLRSLENASRGFNDIRFTKKADLKILVTGFDPFGLHRDIEQSNPSGVAALAFDGLVIEAGIGPSKVTAELQSALFPVRFEDFDSGMVESVIRPLLEPKSEQAIDALVTVSMGREGFDLERFPGRRRSATAPDNLMVLTGANRKAPLLPLLYGVPLEGPEFVEFTLPIRGMLSVQRPYSVTDNRNVATLKGGRFAANSLADIVDQTAVSGSGGGYLSNEISYRTLRLIRSMTRPIAAGHIHTPRIAGADAQTVQRITAQIQSLLTAALPELQKARLSR